VLHHPPAICSAPPEWLRHSRWAQSLLHACCCSTCCYRRCASCCCCCPKWHATSCLGATVSQRCCCCSGGWIGFCRCYLVY
jgi:hypothetical protein